MLEFIKEFKETGPCLVDVEKVVSAWNDKFSISQYGEKLTLVEQVELFQEEQYKLAITEEQAIQIIKKAGLLQIKSPVFSKASTWRSKSNIISEIERLEKLTINNDFHNVIKDTIQSYKQALN